MNYTIKFGKSNIPFSLERRNRKTLAIHVYPDKSIEVIAPREASIEKIKRKVLKRAPWIICKQIEFSRIQPPLPKPLFISGETYRYLGQQYRLKIKQGQNDLIKIKGKFIILVCTASLATDKIKDRILKWYRTQAKIIFNQRLKHCMKKVNKIGISKEPEWALRIMSKQWGSCTKKGKLLLHPELVAAPKECINYIIAHELCHLIEHNHGSKFYELLSTVMPDWEKRKNKLNETIEVRLM